MSTSRKPQEDGNRATNPNQVPITPSTTTQALDNSASVSGANTVSGSQKGANLKDKMLGKSKLNATRTQTSTPSNQTDTSAASASTSTKKSKSRKPATSSAKNENDT